MNFNYIFNVNFAEKTASYIIIIILDLALLSESYNTESDGEFI